MTDPDSAAEMSSRRGYPRTAQYGKEHIYVIEKEEDQVHEEEAAIRIAELA